ncbi:hypothetical protein ACQ4PT_005371 [Festuca glaucescens]
MAGGGGDDLKLQGPWASPHVLRVRLALGLRGVSYQYVEEQDLKKDSIELLLQSTRPVLVHGGEPVRGTSLNMVQYVDEAFAGVGPSLLPDDPFERAAARYLADFIDDTLIKAMYTASWGKTDGERAEGKKQAAAAVETLEGALRERSKPFFGGDMAGFVDVVLGSLLVWVRASDPMQDVKTFDPTTTPLLAEWTKHFGALTAVDEVMPEEAKLAKIFPMASPARRRSGGWFNHMVSALLFVFVFLPLVRKWWYTISPGWVEPAAEEIPRVISLALSMAFAGWFMERCRIVFATLMKVSTP